MHAMNGETWMMIKAGYDPVKAGRLNIGRSDIMNAVKSVNDGTAIGVYRDNDKKVPVLLRTEMNSSWNTEGLEDLQIWNGTNSAPLGQVTDGLNLAWEYPLVRTYNRQLSMAAQCDVKRGHTMKEVHSEIREEIENIKLPEGYSFFWDSQYKDQKEAMAALTKYFPLAIIMLTVILVMLSEFPATAYYLSYFAVITHRNGIRPVAYRIPVWFLLHRRLAGTIGYDH